MTRDPKELLISAQNWLTEYRRKIPVRGQAEWDTVTEAIEVMERCLKLLEKK